MYIFGRNINNKWATLVVIVAGLLLIFFVAKQCT
jgi:type IV secretory pathway VirB2 component (pilin)